MPHSVIASQALLAALSKLEVRHTALHETNEETKLINEKLRDENEVLKAKNAELAALVLLLKTEKHADAAVVLLHLVYAPDQLLRLPAPARKTKTKS